MTFNSITIEAVIDFIADQQPPRYLAAAFHHHDNERMRLLIIGNPIPDHIVIGDHVIITGRLGAQTVDKGTTVYADELRKVTGEPPPLDRRTA